MEQILDWLTSSTGIITTITAFVAAVLLLIQHSKTIIWKPLTKLGSILFGWMHKEQNADIKLMKESLEQFFEKSNARDDEIVGMIDNLRERVDGNERDRIRAEIFHYGHIARDKHQISDEEWRHIQDIYYKYHDILKGNGAITEEYEYIKQYYYSQFNEEV